MSHFGCIFFKSPISGFDIFIHHKSKLPQIDSLVFQIVHLPI